MPADYVQQKVAEISVGGATIDEATIQAMYEMYGLADSSFVGILKGYLSWLGSICRLDFGNCFTTNTPVLQEIASHMKVSFIIAFIAIILEYMIAIPLGITAATHQYSLRDYLVTIFVVIGISMPSFFFGRVLQAIFSPNVFPMSGLGNKTVDSSGIAALGDYLWHIALPLFVMVILSIGGTMRYMRTNMLEVLNSDYIRTARAKGLKESKVIYKHAFRNTMIPIVTMFAGVLPSLFSGAMITEQVFDLPGIGNWALTATTSADIPAIMGYNMFLAFLSVVGVLLSDLMYVVVDPRVKLS
jgi:peptide/nickel transport system permease protein